MQTILVIEDDRAIREAVVDILELEDYRVLSAEDGMVGVTLARKESPNLIICDIVMPYLDGYGVLAQLRKHPETMTVPFIFLTARTTAHDVRQGMNLGADDYLTKPFRADELVRTVQTRLERQARLADKLQSRVEGLHKSLMSVLPHELNTPLHGIVAGVEFLREEYATLEPGDVEELLWIIHQSALRMRRLVTNSLLHADLGQMRAANIAPPRAPIAVAPIIQQIAEQEAAAAMRASDLRVQVENCKLPILPEHLSKIVEELANNAFKFSHAESSVEVIACVQGDQYCLSITDHGWGMSSEEIAATGAFQQFQRKQHEQQGLGLGMEITRRLVALYRGNLHIESVPGEHTTVQITFPLSPVDHLSSH